MKQIDEIIQNNAPMQTIRAQSAAHLQMHQDSIRARKLTAKINRAYVSQKRIRAIMTRLTGQEVDNSFTLFPPFYTDYGQNTHFGKNVFINSGCCFQDQGGIFIGDSVLIGHQVVLATLNHVLEPNTRADMIPKPIVIESNVWVGSHATILSGVTIGKNAVITAGAVVTKDVLPNTVVGGVPASVIKQL